MGDGASLFGLSLPFAVAWMVFGDYELHVDSQEGALLIIESRRMGMRACRGFKETS